MRIALIRHGRPTAADNPRVDAHGFAAWVQSYDGSPVSAVSPAPDGLRDALAGFHVVASPLRRALHSVQLCLGRDADRVLPELREMDIPHYRLPLRLRAWHWVFVNRALWMAGVPGPFESFGMARRRSHQAALRLEELAAVHGDLAVFGHGLTHAFVARHLRARGWQGTGRLLKYWEVGWLTR